MGSARHLGGGGRWRADVPGPALVRRYWSDESSPGCGLGRLGPPLPTKRRSRVVAGIQWVRLFDTMHTPITGVAKRASSPNTVTTLKTKPYPSHMANFSRFAN